MTHEHPRAERGRLAQRREQLLSEMRADANAAMDAAPPPAAHADLIAEARSVPKSLAAADWADLVCRLADALEAAGRDTERLIRQRDEARAFGEKAAAAHNELLADRRVLRCAFCDVAYPDGTPATQHDALTAHVLVCPAHPMRAVERALEAARRDTERLDWLSGRRVRSFDQRGERFEYVPGEMCSDDENKALARAVIDAARGSQASESSE